MELNTTKETEMTPDVEARRKAATKASVIRVYELKLALAKNETDRATLRANLAKASA